MPMHTNIPIKGLINKDINILAPSPCPTITPLLPKHHSERPCGLFSTRSPPLTQQHTSAPPPEFPHPGLDPQPTSYRMHTPKSQRQHQTPPTQFLPPPPQSQPRFRTASQPQPPPQSAPPSIPHPSPAYTTCPPSGPLTSPLLPPQPSTPQPLPPSLQCPSCIY
ncbi:uncharacterized protein EDB91DRAFT_1250173 [Suillus paluster]|uniref:uncharacterized protein n=1 Tax=Suillus paluster TaxID=48578 RepID=UPI001B85F827|nr:uncharacterized protein EDB91DRAFT_1250173 [Suillus paluster]KAG1736162.1 hypothetical protein EDB91DRAFT_1250173 [Suillus paluster]